MIRSLFEIRRAHKISQCRIEKRAGLASGTISRWEGGVGGRLESVRAYANALGFDIVLVKIPK